MRKIALIPAYEPDFSLLNLVYELNDNNFDIIVVDDGSGKKYSPIFNACQSVAAVISYPDNKGKGTALKTGLIYIRENFIGPYVVVTVDSDGQHKVKDVINVCEEAAKHPESLVLGSRKFDNDVPLRSKFGNTVTRFVYRITSGMKVYDTQTGLRAFSQSLISRLCEIEGERYEYEMNVLMNFAKENRNIKEVWIETVYIEDNKSSHFNTIKDSWKIYKEILKFSASSFLSFLLDYGLYCLFFFISGQIFFANITARLFSASFNYSFNKKLVFKSKRSFWKSAVGYILLAVAILFFNTVILTILTESGVNIYLAKVLTEAVMFIVSYTVQHFIIFKKETLSYEKA
ncbi:MAG: bifunctional glycosyltransferase family 2/GtrA family protein [Eubacterium sp.]|nr:bifunctional glycosyltransferase family 2/GtrA family protein [Eubacterium sp.]